jgi:hypothetical protein
MVVASLLGVQGVCIATGPIDAGKTVVGVEGVSDSANVVDAIKTAGILRDSKKLTSPSMAQLNSILKVLNVSGITGGKVAASMKSASDRGMHILKKLLMKNDAASLAAALTPEEVKHIAFILVPVKAFFTQIRKAGDMIVPLIKESLDDQSVGLPFLIVYFESQDDCDIQTYLEKIITTRQALVLFCREMATFCGDVQASFSDDVIKLQQAFQLEQKMKNKEKVDKAPVK